VIHADVSEGRRDAIASYGAEVIRIKGNFDDSAQHAIALAEQSGWELVADTSSLGHEQTCLDVMRGYTVMAAETLHQILAAGGQMPTHVFIQGGVGGLAAAVCAHFWEVLDAAAPVFVMVEPDRADCLYQSARQRRPVKTSADLKTVMAGLACGEPSPVAWQILRKAVEFFMTVSDAEAISVMRMLADASRVGAHIVAGESGGAGVAGFLKVASDPASRKLLRLDQDSRVLAFGTEGATDPAIYAACMKGEL
jgi:diaminopropionate ammonia-lyase